MALQLWQDVVKAAPGRLVLIWQMLQLTRPLVDGRVNLNMYPEYYDAFSIAPSYNALITEMSDRQTLTTGSNAGDMDLQSAYAGVHEFWYAVRDYYTGKNAESCDASEALRIQELMHAFTEEISVPLVIPTPNPTPATFGAPFEGGFYTGMIWNHIALSTESKTLATGSIKFKVDQDSAIVYVGQSLEVRSIANPVNKFIGTVLYASVGSITLNVTSIEGSGTFSDWAVMSRFRNIVAPKSQGETTAALKFENTPMPEATQTVTEGWAATNSMLAGGTDTQYPAAHWARALNINGYTDWYIPARDELELMWRNLKPQAIDNSIGARYASPVDYKKDGAYPDSVMTQGINLNSIPAGAAYTALLPAQTDALAFRAGGPEEFLWNQYFWSSSEVSAADAWLQYWYASVPGFQRNFNKASPRRVRAVRRSII